MVSSADRPRDESKRLKVHSLDSQGMLLDLPATIAQYGDLPLLDLGARFRCQGCGYRPAEIRIGWGLPESQARGWMELREAGNIVIVDLPGHEDNRHELGCQEELALCDGQWIVVPRAQAK